MTDDEFTAYRTQKARIVLDFVLGSSIGKLAAREGCGEAHVTSVLRTACREVLKHERLRNIKPKHYVLFTEYIHQTTHRLFDMYLNPYTQYGSPAYFINTELLRDTYGQAI